MIIDTASPGPAREVLARSLVQIRKLRARLDEVELARTEPIAVIGMGCRLPGGVRSPEQYWDLLLRGERGTGPVPADRWDPGRWGGTTGGGFLDEVDRFDAGFFGISPREAAALDPQQRMFLEVAWEALEHAGQAPDRLTSSATGVYVGVTTYDYTQAQMQHVVPDELEMYCTTSNASTFAAGRLSYWLGLSGPSMSVDTACSSSLVSVHLACQSLRSGETSMALAGGVNVLLSPEWFLLMSQAGMLAEDGRCKTFDASADGYARGEGCGVVVLKRLSTALADNDRIDGLILGSAVNHDGRSSGITVPNPAAQTEVVRAALRMAGVDGDRVGYIEAHGTGTPLGDPIELRALRAALGAPAGSEPPLVGSAKTNIGHLEAAAGVVGLIKALLTVRHGVVPKHLNLKTVNPAIDLDQLHLRIPVDTTAFPAGTGPRVAGVSAFGVSGTNAHVVVGEPPAPEPGADVPEPRHDHLLTLSAKSSAALADMVRAYQDWLATADDRDLSDLCYTAAVGRAVLPFRAAVVGSTAQVLRERLTETMGPAEDASPSVHTGRVSASDRPRVAFLFTGQGSQYTPMAATLYRTEPLVRELFDKADELLEPVLGRRLLPLLLDGALGAGLIDETRYTQPALFLVEYAVAQLWRSWGVEPAAVLGHSIGELAAACVAGAMDWTDGVLLAAHRGRLMQDLTPAGAMTTVFADVERVRELLAQDGPGLCVSAVNGPQSVVVAGAPEAMERFAPVLAEAGIGSRSINSAKAFHSPLMEPMLDQFEAEAEKIAYQAPRIPLISNVTGAPLGGEGGVDAAYWRRHALAPVDFHRGMRAVFDQGCTVFIEVGPSPVLCGMAARFAPPPAAGGRDPLFLPSLRQRHDDNRVLLNSLAGLHTRGVPVDWAKVYAGRGQRKVVAPTYPFRPDRHWYTPSVPAPGTAAPVPAVPGSASAAGGTATGGALLGASIPCALDSRLFEVRIDPAAHACLRDCVLEELPVVNAGVYLDVAMSAARRDGVTGSIAIEDYSIPQSLIANEVYAGQLALEPVDETRHAYRFFARPESAGESADWVLHAKGRVGPAGSGIAAAAVDEARLAAEFEQRTGGEDYYAQLRRRTIHLGPSAQWIDHIWHRPGAAVARMRPAAAGEADPYLLHPGLTDSLLQMLFVCVPEGDRPDAAYMLLGIDRLTFHGHDGRAVYCRATVTRSGYSGDVLTATLDVRDAGGNPVLSAEGVYMKRADKAAVTSQGTNAGAHGAPRHKAARSAAPVGVAGAARARILALPATERAAETRKLITATIAGALGSQAEDLDLDEPLPALGLDSLMALEANDQLTRQLAVSLPLVAFIEGSNINGLTDLVLDALGEPPREGAEPGAVASLDAAADEPPRIVPDPDSRFESFPLTDLQQAYMIGRTDAFELGNVSTYFFTEVDLDGADLDLIADKLNLLIARHDMLRAVMNGDSTQRVLPHVPRYEIRTYDVSGLDADARDRQLAAVHEEMRDQVLDATRWPLFDVRATILGEGRIRLHVAHEALVSDGWSASTVFREWAQAVRGERLDEPAEITFRDYVLAVKELEKGPEYAASLEYWRGRVATLPPAPELPLARDPRTVRRPHFAHRSHRLDREAWAAFRERASAAGVTASAAICAAYTEVIGQWSKVPDFTLNVLFFNRMPLHPQVDAVVGNFSSTVLLEVHAGGGRPFSEHAVNVQQQLWQDLGHSRVSGVRVLRELNQRGESVRASVPVVFASTVIFGARDTRAAGVGLVQHLLALGDEGREVSSAIRTPQVFLDHQVIEDDGELIVNWDVVEDLFPPGLIDAMYAAYAGLLDELATSPAAWTRSIAPLAGERDLAVRRRVNATAGPRPEGLLHDGFLANAAERPERLAVITPGRGITYGELDALSNRIANWLRGRGTAPGQLVGVVMHKGWEQVAGALGILKAGAVYVPIDAAVPDERLRTLCQTSGITVALTQPGAPAARSWPDGVERLVIDDATLAVTSDAPPSPSPADPDDLAYVIFTSGSTGTPKGVMIEHRAAGNTIADVNDRFAVTDRDRVLALSAFNFDLSVYDVFGMLSAGGAIVLPEPEAKQQPSRWADLVREYGVTIWNSVPALMELFAQHLAAPTAQPADSIRLVMMSGDWIPVTLPDLVRRVLPGTAVWSLGGATEASIWSIWYPIDRVDPRWTSIPYGVPMRNQQFHVLDEQLRPRPAWVPGELYIGGDGLARGYHGDEEKTRASFIRHPATGERLYRTGDLGRYRPDGVIEFLGREDSQVKVQGYRIELEEIETAIAHCEGVRSAVVRALGERQGPKRLVAYVVFQPGADPDTGRLESALRAVLPEYMVPRQFVRIEEVPLTANGKVDRGALPDPSGGLGEVAGRAPAGETETRLAAIWAEFFDPALVTADAGFFALGGDSLTAVRLMARIEAEWERVLPVSLLFARPTIAQLAEALADDGGTDRRKALVPVHMEGTRPPLFFVHPVGGDVLCYASLAARLGDRPFYALQTPDDLDAPSLTDLAAHYVDAVLSVVPDGPWLLGGWSMGGVVAIEMSRLLAASGRGADLVVAVDLLEPPGPAPHGPLGDDDLFDWFARDLAGLSGREWVARPAAYGGEDGADTGEPATYPDRVQSLRQSLVTAGVLPPDVSVEAFQRIVDRFMANSRLLEAHRPAPSGVRTLLLRAADGGADEKTTTAWVELLGGEDVRVEAVPGDHYSVVAEPAVDAVADAIRRAVNP